MANTCILEKPDPAKVFKQWPRRFYAERSANGEGFIIYIHEQPIMDGETGEPAIWKANEFTDQFCRTMTRLCGAEVVLERK